jgi:hypothetical protein
LFRSRQSCAQLDDAKEFPKQRVIAVGSVKSVTTVGPTGDKANRAKFTQFVLNRAKSEPTHVRQFAHIALVLRFGEKQPQHLRAHFLKQHIQNRAFRLHGISVALTALSSQA